MQAVDFFRSRIDAMINMNDPLAVLASRLPWSQIEGAVAQKFEHQNVGMKIKHIVVDLGFRGVDAANPDKEIIHRGKFKSLSKQQKRWLKRRTAVEPAIGHLKSDHRMDRCWLQGSLGPSETPPSPALPPSLAPLARNVELEGGRASLPAFFRNWPDQRWRTWFHIRHCGKGGGQGSRRCCWCHETGLRKVTTLRDINCN